MQFIPHLGEVGVFLQGYDKSFFKNLVTIHIQSEITEEVIRLKVELNVLIHNKNQIFDLNMVTSNLDNIPSVETDLITA